MPRGESEKSAAGVVVVVVVIVLVLYAQHFPSVAKAVRFLRYDTGRSVKSRVLIICGAAHTSPCPSAAKDGVQT